MRAVTTQGENVEYKQGQAVCGRRFKSITFFPSDLNCKDSVLNKKRIDKWVSHLLNVRLDRGIDMNEQELENEIVRKNLNAPRVTPEMISDNIVGEEYHVFDGTTVTTCLLTLANGFSVTGESACASIENFDEQLGRKIARDNAKDKIWSLMGYALKSQGVA